MAYCMCRWCNLARMNGLELRRWQSKVKKNLSKQPDIFLICSKCGKGLPISQKTHKCSSSDIGTVRKMLEVIPETLKTKITYSILKEVQENNVSDPIKVTTNNEGNSVQAHLT